MLNGIDLENIQWVKNSILRIMPLEDETFSQYQRMSWMNDTF